MVSLCPVCVLPWFYSMIEGVKINLRAIEDDDAELFHRWFNDEDVAYFSGGNRFPAPSLAQERAYVQSVQDDKNARHYTITLKDGTAIGNCALRSIDWIARSSELGITIGEKAYWGQGYGGEAIELLLRIAFDGLNLHKVWLGCFDFNERGLRAYRRMGFVQEGRLRDEKYVDGRYHDLILMAILEDDWRERQQQ